MPYRWLIVGTIARLSPLVGTSGLNTMSKLFTRQEYMEASREDGPAAHRRYYAQFVCENTKPRLLCSISRAEILASADPHFNDIPLKLWDNVPLIYNRELMRLAGDYLTAAGKVCILKEAALQIKESGQPPCPDVRSRCGTIRLSFHPEWSQARPWASYRHGTAGLHFASLEDAKRHFHQYIFTE